MELCTELSIVEARGYLSGNPDRRCIIRRWGTGIPVRIRDGSYQWFDGDGWITMRMHDEPHFVAAGEVDR